MPRLDEFKPQMIFISAGFDGHYEDDMGGMKLFEKDYAWVTTQLRGVAARHANNRIVSMLEGANVRVKRLKDIEGKRAEIPN